MSETTQRLAGDRRTGRPLGRRGRGGLGALEGLVYRSNLLGADRALANQGGGNTSAKGTVTDHAGRETRVLWVKGSGTDLATITPAGFAALRLDEILPLRARAEMDDAEMVDYLLRTALGPDQPRPSIETLLHAFVSAPHVDHTHPDAVIALTSSPDGRRLAADAFGDEAVWLDYQRPGFDMSRRIAELAGGSSRAHVPSCSRSTGSSRGARPARRATGARSSSSAAPPTRSDRRREERRPRRDQGRSNSRTTRRTTCLRAASRRCAARSSPTPTASCWKSTEAPPQWRSPRRRGGPRSARSARRAPTI